MEKSWFGRDCVEKVARYSRQLVRKLRIPSPGYNTFDRRRDWRQTGIGSEDRQISYRQKSKDVSFDIFFFCSIYIFIFALYFCSIYSFIWNIRIFFDFLNIFILMIIHWLIFFIDLSTHDFCICVVALNSHWAKFLH